MSVCVISQLVINSWYSTVEKELYLGLYKSLRLILYSKYVICSYQFIVNILNGNAVYIFGYISPYLLQAFYKLTYNIKLDIAIKLDYIFKQNMLFKKLITYYVLCRRWAKIFCWDNLLNSNFYKLYVIMKPLLKQR